MYDIIPCLKAIHIPLRIEGYRLNKKENVLDLLIVLIGVGVLITAAFGFFYSNGGERFTAVNVYGNTVELYGDGIYAYNSVFTVANRLGADAAGSVFAIGLIALTLWKKRPLWAEIIRTSLLILLAYFSACLVFGVSMNALYFLYVTCLGLSIFVSFILVQNLLKRIAIPQSLQEKRLTGTGIFLISAGMITASLWVSSIIPAILNNGYGTLLGIQTTEATYGLDLSMACPIMILCGIWLLMKKDVGYKVAPLLLNMLVGIAVLVLCQRAFCVKLGIAIPLGALIGFIVSFVIMGVISLFLSIKLLKQLERAD